MSEFRTDISLGSSPVKIGLNDQILTFGSCFSDVIGQRLHENKFSIMVNPFGVIYNPIALHRAIIMSVNGARPSPEMYAQSGDIFVSYDLHSRFSALDGDALTNQINDIFDQTNKKITSADYILITYGTSWAYELMGNAGYVVANCHKTPAKNFIKRLLTIEEVVASFSDLYQVIKKARPQLKIILTISPVRHLKDTLTLNNVSKSVLRVACHDILQKFTDVDYFPAFEIMIDDLRDYRFYKTDMIHPNDQAENYIWKMFISQYLTQEAQSFIQEWQGILKDLNHKPFHSGSTGYKNFLSQLLKKLEVIRDIVPVDEEIKKVRDQLIR